MKRPKGPEYASRMSSPRFLARMHERIAAACAGFLAAAAGAKEDQVRAAVASFFDIYDERPIEDNSGGSGFNDCLLLYLTVHLLAPRLIVESGVYKGQTSWILRRAAPEARILAFDVELDQRDHIDPSITYHGGDWLEVEVGEVDPATALCFFDDHINQAQRVREAYDRGFRTLLFDDDFVAEALYATGHPPVPTISMLFDDELKPGDRIEWQRHGRRRHYVHDPADTHGARELIASRHLAPDLTALTRYRPQSGLTVVKLT
ncbi:MAG: hypothetical protein V3S44_07020 [Alphaproteobacteria bacterium]